MAVAGKVAITLSTENGGAWSADVTYDRLVAVKHNNNLYISRKTVANVEPPNDEFWFPALEGFSGEDIEKIISGETVVGNANLLEGLTAEEVGASGARNLIPYPYYETTHTEDGITWVDNGDGTVTANGTATAESVFYLQIKFILPAGTYSLSGCPSGGGGTLYSIQIADNAWVNHFADFGNGRTFSTTEEVNFAQFRLRVGSGTTVENLIFKPMLELGSVAHDYVPYHFGGAEDAKTVNGFAVYTDVSQLGLSTTATLLEVYNAMPYLSELECNSSVLTDDSWNFPSTAGTVKIVKINAIRGYLEFRQKTGTAFYWMGLDNSNPSLPDGVWHNIGDGGNAKTLDGHGAEYFAPKAYLANYLPLTGGKLSGEITIETSGSISSALWLKNGARNIVEAVYPNGNFALYDVTYSKDIINSTASGTNTFNGTASGNLPLTGGNLGNGSSGTPLRVIGKSDGTYIIFNDNTGDKAYLGINALGKLVMLESDFTTREIFHTGNKPTGTYTGNGSTTVRNINISGIGALIVVYSENGLAFITAFGVATIDKNGDAKFTQDAYMSGDNIIMSSTNTVLNASGTTYYTARL